MTLATTTLTEEEVAEAVVLPDQPTIERYLRAADLTLDEIEAIKAFDATMRKSYSGVFTAVLTLAAECRDEVFYETTKAYGLSREMVDQITTNGAGKLAAMNKEGRDALLTIMKAMKKEGQTQQQIADAMGMSRQHTARLLNEGEHQCSSMSNGDQPSSAGELPDNRKRLTAEQEAEIVRLLGEGMTQREVAKRFGVAQSTIPKVIARQGKAAQAAMEPKEALPDGASAGSRVVTGGTNHSPSLTALRTAGTPEHLLMQEDYVRYVTRLKRMLKVLEAQERQLQALQNHLADDFARYHGSMLARWYAYEKLWDHEVQETTGGGGNLLSLRDAVAQRFKDLQKKVAEACQPLTRINPTHITLED